MAQTMDQMLAEHATRLRQNDEATASLVQYHKEHTPPVPHLVRNGWRDTRLPRRRGPVSRQRRRLLNLRTSWTNSRPPSRIEWPQLGGCFIRRSPDHSELARVAWNKSLARPFRVGAFQGAPDTPGGFWSWIQYSGSMNHVVRDYTKHYHQHIDMDIQEIQMVTHESALFYKGPWPNGTTESWSEISAAPVSLYLNGSITTEGSSGLERFDAVSNACYGIDSRGKPYFDDNGTAPPRDRARLKYDGNIIWLEQ